MKYPELENREKNSRFFEFFENLSMTHLNDLIRDVIEFLLKMNLLLL